MQENKSGYILCFADDWGRHPSSTQHIMRVLSRDLKVLWVESLGFRKPGVSKRDLLRIFFKIKNYIQGVKEMEKNIYVLTPLVIPLHRYGWIRWINQWLLSLILKSYLRKNKVDKFILWISHPSAEPMAKRLGESKTVYYCGDEYAEFTSFSRELVMKLERDLLKKVDLVLVVSERLYQTKKEYNPNIFLIPHGVEFDHFSRYNLTFMELPADIKYIKRPIIGYYGLIRDWIDFELLEKITQKKDWSLVLIGPTSVDISKIQVKENMHFLGPKNYKDLPLYLQGFDVCIIPYKLTEITINSRPLKLFEYLASGKPVVSTPLPSVLPYRDVVRIGSTHEEFIQQIEKSLQEKDEFLKKKRIDLARENSWEKLVEKNLKPLLLA